MNYIQISDKELNILQKETEMDRKVFEKFKGERVTVTLTNSIGLIF